MDLVSIVITIAVVGIILFVLNTYIPMQETVKKILNITVIVFLLLWLIRIFGLAHYFNRIHGPNRWKASGYFLLISIVSFALYDVIARVRGTNATLSEFIRFYAEKYPSLIILGSFGAGFLVCHLIGAMTTTKEQGY